MGPNERPDGPQRRGVAAGSSLSRLGPQARRWCPGPWPRAPGGGPSRGRSAAPAPAAAVGSGRPGRGPNPHGRPCHPAPITPGPEGPLTRRPSGPEPCRWREPHFCGPLVGDRLLPRGSHRQLAWEPWCRVAAPRGEGAFAWECVVPLALCLPALWLRSSWFRRRGGWGPCWQQERRTLGPPARTEVQAECGHSARRRPWVLALRPGPAWLVRRSPLCVGPAFSSCRLSGRSSLSKGSWRFQGENGPRTAVGGTLEAATC